MNLLTVEIDGAVHKKSTVLAELPVFHGIGGLQPSINPTSNKSMLQATDDQQIDATKYLLVEASTNLMLASESSTLSTRAPLPSQEDAILSYCHDPLTQGIELKIAIPILCKSLVL